MIIDSQLVKLAELFPVPLYVVGGAVRDFLCGFNQKDVDICSSLSPEKVKKLLQNSDFQVYDNSPKLGTLKIALENSFWEYTAFRTDSYAMDGKHQPLEVKFTDDMNADARRRDFTINAIYYDIKQHNIIDSVGGQDDIKNRLIRTVRDAKVVFMEDGLRILRMIRIACQTGFEIEEETFLQAKNLIDVLDEIAPCRIKDEFEKILVADTTNGIVDAQIRGIQLLVDTGAIKYIVPELLDGIGFKQRPDFHLYDVYGHIIKVVQGCQPDIRLAGLFHDIAKPAVKLATGFSKGHAEAGAVIAENRLKHLCFGKSQIEKVKTLVKYHMYDLKLDTPESELRRFIQKNHLYLFSLIKLKDADHVGSGIRKGRSPSGMRLEALYEQMKREGIPMTIKELKIKGEDLINLNIPPERRSEVMGKILDKCADGGEILKRENQIDFAKNLMK